MKYVTLWFSPLDLPILLVAYAVDSCTRKIVERTILTYDRPIISVYYLNVSTMNACAVIIGQSMKNKTYWMNWANIFISLQFYTVHPNKIPTNNAISSLRFRLILTGWTLICSSFLALLLWMRARSFFGFVSPKRPRKNE